MYGPDIARRTPTLRQRALRRAMMAQWQRSAPAGGATAMECLRLGQDPLRRLDVLRRQPRARYGVSPAS